MNLQQLEYIVSLEQYRHFSKAAEHNFVTQPTLSMMVQKLEAELGLRIFDREAKPLVPTRDGEEVIRRAKSILAEVRHLRDFAEQLKGSIEGTLRLGVIPTLAPYLLPRLLPVFAERHPQVQLLIKEALTNEIVSLLLAGELDMGLVATPLHEKNIREVPLYYEPFWAYAAQSEKLPPKKYVLPSDIGTHRLWLLEEGHCMRAQALQLCSLRKRGERHGHGIQYEAGSIETLIHLVDRNGGVTIVPELALEHLSSLQRKNVREFAPPAPAREISIIVAEHFPRTHLVETLRRDICEQVPLPNVPGERTVLGMS